MNVTNHIAAASLQYHHYMLGGAVERLAFRLGEEPRLFLAMEGGILIAVLLFAVGLSSRRLLLTATFLAYLFAKGAPESMLGMSYAAGRTAGATSEQALGADEELRLQRGILVGECQRRFALFYVTRTMSRHDYLEAFVKCTLVAFAVPNGDSDPADLLEPPSYPDPADPTDPYWQNGVPDGNASGRPVECGR